MSPAANSTQTTTGNVITAAQKQWDSWVTREAKARSSSFPWYSSGNRVHVVRERHLSTISSTHKVDTTSRCADLSARISPPQRQLLRQLAQIDAKCKSATPKTRTIHSISCLLMKAVLILNHSQHTLYWQAQRHRSHTCKLTKWERRKKNLQKWKNTKPGRLFLDCPTCE